MDTFLLQLKKKILKINELASNLSRDAFDLEAYIALQEDIFFELQTPEKTQNFKDNQDYYLGLDANALNTSVIDFINILKLIPQAAVIADIGSGHSLMSITANIVADHLKIISIEPMAQRFLIAKQFNDFCKGIHSFYPVHFEDIDNDILIDFLFIYLPGGILLENILSKILELKNYPKYILAIESHGELINRLDHFSYFQNKKIFTRLLFPRLDQNCYIYEFNINNKRNDVDEFIKKFYSDNFIIKLSDVNGDWVASTKDASLFFLTFDSILIECIHPPRTIKIKTTEVSNLKLLAKSSLPNRISELVQRMQRQEKINDKFIRKIYFDKNICELSDGSLVTL